MAIDTAQLADWQIDLGGILIGHGTTVLIRDIEGIGTPDRRAGDRPIPGEDGNYPGRDTYAPRTLRIAAGIRTPGRPDAALDQFAALEQAADTQVRLTPGATDVLRIRRPGQPVRRLYGRLAGVEAVSLVDAVFGWVPVQITYVGLDPAWYADTPSGVLLHLDVDPQRKDGFEAPLRAPMTTGTANPAARPGWAPNAGNRPAWPTLRITGPVVNPRVWLEGVPGAVLDFDLALGDGEWIDIETRPGTRWVLRNGGQGSAAGALRRASRLDAFQIPPGRTEVRWTAQDATNTARLSVTWRDAHSSL
ncbi:hypothetical protein AB0O82_10690 [Kitasatospora sp. NPDC088264]|uniref:hypothetical protein n=1 Tax=Kitasatospora sp. NPDC088264 TaxID=3155296 RepID=UPI003432D421